MPGRICWVIPSHLILLQNIGVVTEEDTHHNDLQIIQMLDSSTKPLVHILIDDRLMEEMPPLRVMMKLQFIHHPHIGWVISQQQNPVLRMIGAVVGSAVKIRFRYVTDLQEGLSHLAKVDSTLPDIIEMTHLIEAATQV